MQQYIKILFIHIWRSTCFGRHIAHHQDPKTGIAASDFVYVESCWTCSCWTLSGTVILDAVRKSYTLPDSVQQLHLQQPSTYAKPEAASAVLGSWWWAVCRPKHVELHIYVKYNFDTLLHPVGFSLWIRFLDVFAVKGTVFLFRNLVTSYFVS
jgi:hypothetical protein